MTAANFDRIHTPGLPRRAILVSIAVHAAALILLPGLARDAKKLELPPLLATLRLAAPAEPAAVIAPPQPVHEARPQPRAAKPVREEHVAVRTAEPARNEPPAPAVVAQAAPAAGPEKAAREEAPAIAAAPQPVRPSAPAPAVQDSLVLDSYGRALSDLLARQQQYPRLAALRGWEGEVRLRLRVARKGSLVAVEVVHSSGHEILDQHALQLIQAAALPAPPDALGDREIQVVVPIHYKLQKPA